ERANGRFPLRGRVGRDALPHGRRGGRGDARLEDDRLPVGSCWHAAGNSGRPVVPDPGAGRPGLPSSVLRPGLPGRLIHGPQATGYPRNARAPTRAVGARGPSCPASFGRSYDTSEVALWAL